MNVTSLLLLLLVGAIATFLAGNKLASRVALFFSVIGFGFACFLTSTFLSGTSVDFSLLWIKAPKVYLAFQADGLGLAMVLLTTSLLPIIILSSFNNQFQNAKNFYALVLFMAFAMVGTFLASDGLLYYIFWELALIPIYFIALIWGNDDAEARKKAVVKFFIYTLAGSLFMLVGFGYLYQKGGSFQLQTLYNLKLSAQEQTWIFLGFFMAYAVKIPLIPFHTWQANVYQKAPAVGTMLLSGIMLKMGLYSIIRWQLPIAPLAAKANIILLTAIGVAGVIYGSILALKQKNLKKLLAYSSLAHVGLIAAGIYTLKIDGLSGAVSQMIAHGFVIVGLFFVAELIEQRYKTQLIGEMGGIRTQAPKFTSFFLILVLASVALPGTFNFVAEFTVLYSLAQTNIVIAVLGGTTIILGAYYMLKMFQNVMLGETNIVLFKDLAINEIIVLVSIVAFLVFFGLYPKPFVDLVNPSLAEVLKVINK
jgi:NADH-quinone oxidoreductase subunit M